MVYFFKCIILGLFVVNTNIIVFYKAVIIEFMVSNI